jgi:hypothetical protein
MAGLLARALRRMRRIVEPLVDPEAPDRRRGEAETRERLEEIASATTTLSREVERLTRRFEKVDRAQSADLQRVGGILDRATKRQSTLVERLTRARSRSELHEFARDRVLQHLHRIARGSGPVIVGPWTGEVGFELLYWAPFVRWAIHKYDIDPARVVVLSRGGTASWYGLGGRYVDIFDLVSPDEFRAGTSGGCKKQQWMRLFDRHLVRRATVHLDRGRPSVLHPSLMYTLFMPYWAVEEPRRWVEQFAEFIRLDPPDIIDAAKLPREFIAARFYFSDAFPDTPDNRAFAAAWIRAAATQHDVVVIGSGVRVDDHADFAIGTSNRIHSVDHLMQPATNLAVQTAVIGRASAFIGTYGGFAYLAPFCGVNALAVYSRPSYYENHHVLATTAFAAVGGGTLTVADADTLRRLGAPAMFRPSVVPD